MAYDDRFGLPLSLVEALRAESSPDARTLADLLADEDEQSVSKSSGRDVVSARPWASLAAGLALCASLGFPAQAASLNLQGEWRMAPASSAFREAVTGPAPDTATVRVVRDDAERLAYQLVETRGGVEVARGAYDISFTGAPSTSSVGGATLQVVATRDSAGGVLIEAPEVGGLQASIHMRQTGADTAVLEHDVRSADGAIAVERISLVRGAP